LCKSQKGNSQKALFNRYVKRGYSFPGQGSQFVRMGKEMYETNSLAKELFGSANHILGFLFVNLKTSVNLV